MRYFTLLLLVTLFACNSSNSKSSEASIEHETVLAEIAIEGMTCGGCEQTITANLDLIDGVETKKVSHLDKNAIVEYDKALADTSSLFEAIRKSGYTVIAYHSVQADSTSH